MAKCIFQWLSRRGCYYKRVAERPSKDRRRIAEGSLTFGLKISDLQFCMIHTRNALVFRGYVIAT